MKHPAQGNVEVMPAVRSRTREKSMPVNILIVEDEWLIAEDYAATLRDAGHEIVGPCATARAAISSIAENPVDAAFLDMDLFGEKSFPVAEELKGRNIPFVFLSGHSTRELPSGMREHQVLSKPVERAALLAAVTRMCRAM
ncbi:response regulator [Rhizobium sp. SAFR-030]|uniref:response regulator n=1 Tax=Rhizobium sp. SAFR-030 TaxID=3387277 RepID=UPI003F805371